MSYGHVGFVAREVYISTGEYLIFQRRTVETEVMRSGLEIR